MGMGVKKRAAFWVAYVYAGLACGTALAAALLFNLLSFPTLSRERWTRWMIHRFSAGLVAYLRRAGLLDIEFEGIAELSGKKGVIIALNHPTYIDAILIMSQLPNVFCLTKASILSNPWVAATARCAGYESNAEPARLVENCCERLRRGETLLVFPEGTRTAIPPLGPLKRGFAIMAVTAAVPVLTVLVNSYNGPYLRQGQPFLQLPDCGTLRYRFELSRSFTHSPGENSKELSQRIEKHFRLMLRDPITPPSEAVTRDQA